MTSALPRVSISKVLFPEPETPQTPVKVPRGRRHPRRAGCSRGHPAPPSNPWGSPACPRTEIFFHPAATSRSGYQPVMISAGVPWATISPPAAPAPGPTSMMWSAARISTGSCSTTITVLPSSRSSSRAPRRASNSLGCMPREGSSTRMVRAVSSLPNRLASWIRCASPAERVPVGRFRCR